MTTYNVPDNYHQFVKEEGMWEDDSCHPIHVTIMETEYKGKQCMSFQLEFSFDDYLGDISDRLEKQGIELDGDGWESLLRKLVKSKNPNLEKNLHGDSEAETCVLWTDNKSDFESLMEVLLYFINGPDKVK